MTYHKHLFAGMVSIVVMGDFSNSNHSWTPLPQHGTMTNSVLIGLGAGENIKSGCCNVFVGNNACSEMKKADHVICLGDNAQAPKDGLSNTLVLPNGIAISIDRKTVERYRKAILDALNVTLKDRRK